nr:lycopene cyclase domain-containing protein [Microbacterium sp. CFBP 8794]
MGAILFSFAGMIAIDLKFGLALRVAPARTSAAVLLSTAFFLVWDVVGIVTGVFVKGESPLFIGVTLAPHLPLEEVFFLLFLSYLSIVMFAVFERRAARRRGLDVSARHPAGAPGERP